MMEAIIEIETLDNTLAMDLFAEKKLRVAREAEIAKGTFLRFEGRILREAVSVPDILRFTLILASSVALPLALDVVANWIYDRVKNGRALKIKINDVEVEINKDAIKEILTKEIKEKPPLKKYFIRLSFPEFSQDEVERAARTLSRRPIIFNGNQISYPDNMTYDAEYVSGNVEAIVYIRNEKINELYEKGRPLYATAQINERYLPRLILTNLILSSKVVPSGCRMKQIKKEEDIPRWL